MCGGKKTKTHAIMDTYLIVVVRIFKFIKMPCDYIKKVNPTHVTFSEMLTLQLITNILQINIIYYPRNSSTGGVGKKMSCAI